MAKGYTPTILSIAGSDPYGGAGVQIDSRTIHALGGYALSVTTALTAQNSTGVKALLPTPIEHFKLQLQTLLEDIQIDAIKIGMLANAQIIEVVAAMIEQYGISTVVLDTVLVSSSGTPLLEPKAVTMMVERLFPLTTLITPNIPEVNHLIGGGYRGGPEQIEATASHLYGLGATALLLKGGHGSSPTHAIDYLLQPNHPAQSFATPWVKTSHTHGTGCLLSSAIATYLAYGKSLAQSVADAKVFLSQKLQTASRLQLHYHDTTRTRREPIF